MIDRFVFAIAGIAAGAAAVWLAIAPHRAAPTVNPADLPHPKRGLVAGYLPPDRIVDALALLPPPPEAGSARQAADEAARQAARALRDTPRWTMATRDAEFRFPGAVAPFACALGVPIDEKTTPQTYMLLRRSLTDAAEAVSAAKKKYARLRPFAASDDSTTCAVNRDGDTRTDTSYPSGHATYGWAWGLILAEVAPDRAEALLKRGYDFGQGRIVCNMHWQSDVDAGRLAGAAVVAQLHADPDFRAQLDAARFETRAVRARESAAPDCALDRQAAQP
ncbi:MAG: phosphatase PAP2 family protein [Rhodoblastus sp.]